MTDFINLEALKKLSTEQLSSVEVVALLQETMQELQRMARVLDMQELQRMARVSDMQMEVINILQQGMKSLCQIMGDPTIQNIDVLRSGLLANIKHSLDAVEKCFKQYKREKEE